MSEEGAEGSDDGEVRAVAPGDEDGGEAFQSVEKQRCGGEVFAPGAQHIGRADIARADGAQILRASQPRQHQAERNRAGEIGREESEN